MYVIMLSAVKRDKLIEEKRTKICISRTLFVPSLVVQYTTCNNNILLV